MAGLVSTVDWTGNAALEAQGTDAIPATTGEVLGAVAAEGFEHALPTFTAGRQTAEMGIDPNSGMPLAEGTFGKTLDPEEATRRYGVGDRLKWTAPVPEGVAQEQSARMRETIAREDAIARREPGLLTGGAARFVAGLAGGLPGIVDPVNIAASFMPVVSEARAAIWAARFGDTAATALKGAVEGAAGQAALTPLQYLQSKQDQEDYGATDALLNIALGGIFGGGLHLLGGRFGSAEGRLAGELDRAEPETREDLLRSAIADLADPARPEDRPVTAPAETYDYIRETGGGTRPYETVPKEPPRLATFLQQEGGLQNQGGELAQLLDRVQSRPGLMNRNGLPLDEAALRAWEAGYLPGIERPDTNTLLDHLESDLKGHPVYSARDEAAAGAFHDAMERNAEIDRLSQEQGIPVSGLTREQFYDQVAQKLGAERTRAEAEAAGAWFTQHEDDIPFFGDNNTPTTRTTFTTAKGSTYEVHPDGTTTRNKSFHPEHGAADQGLQPRSAATFYVNAQDAIKLGEIQSQGGPRRIIAPLGDGQWGVKYLDGKDAGKFEGRTVVSGKTEPAAGLIPVEIFDDGGRVHFGNEITEIGSVELKGLEDAYRQATADLRADAGGTGAERPGPAGRAAGDAEAAGRQGRPGARPQRGGGPDGERAELAEAERPASQVLAEETQQLARELAGAGIEESPELARADDAAAELEAVARACEQSASCLGRRA